MKALDDSIWVRSFPFRLLGAGLGKTMTVMRLPSGDLVVHSSAPVSQAHIAEVKALGRVRWIVEASRMHDTFARRLRMAFPEAEYLVPTGFPLGSADLAPCAPLLPAPEAWTGQIDVLHLEGNPSTQEHVMLHRPSRTLIVADLVFNLQIPAGERVPFFLRWVSGIRAFPATSRLVRLTVRDKTAFRRSIATLLSWDFKRVIVGHGEILATEAKTELRRALAWANSAQDG